MDRAVARLNVERYRRLLAEETDAARRQPIQPAAEETKLSVAEPARQKRKAR